ncbi:MAG: hypothetical protein J6X06_00855 [Elusimicrobiaceae bacterium]|nr:hypothetical protein [Elusimicrobiaceae bacterium]
MPKKQGLFWTYVSTALYNKGVMLNLTEHLPRTPLSKVVMLNLIQHLPRTLLSKVVMLNLIQHLPRMPFAVIK